jgi:aromatic ring-opening dioxygenase catalytic subunit (LigB family)
VQEEHVTIVADAQPELLYDYYGFEPEAYKLQYRAPGDAALAATVRSLLRCKLSIALAYMHDVALADTVRRLLRRARSLATICLPVPELRQ